MVLGREHLHPVLSWLAVAWLAAAIVSAARRRSDGPPAFPAARGVGLLRVGAAALVLALASGELAARLWAGRGEILPESSVGRHRLFGWGALALVALRFFFGRKLPRVAVVLLDLILIFALGVCAWHGMTLTYTFGVNVDLPGSR